jgi:hypothetical protein
MMLEADLDLSPHTMHFFVDDEEQSLFIDHNLQSITFAVCHCSPQGGRVRRSRSVKLGDAMGRRVVR